jgi:hypothetical protein
LINPAELQVSSFTIFGATPTVLVSTSHQWPFTAVIEGHFSVDGTLKSGGMCCVTGDLSTIGFEASEGVIISATCGSLEFALSYHSDIKGITSTVVEICDANGVTSTDLAIVESEIEWNLALLARIGIIGARYGPFVANAGPELGISQGELSVSRGMSNTASFDIGETVQSSSAVLGYFVSLKCDIAGVRMGMTLDVALRGLGDMAWSDKEVVSLSLGVGLGF